MDERAKTALDSVSRGILTELTPHLQNVIWALDSLESAVAEIGAAHGLGMGKMAAPLRAALSGRSVTPSVFDMMLILGRDETCARLSEAAAYS